MKTDVQMCVCVREREHFNLLSMLIFYPKITKKGTSVLYTLLIFSLLICDVLKSFNPLMSH